MRERCFLEEGEGDLTSYYSYRLIAARITVQRGNSFEKKK